MFYSVIIPTIGRSTLARAVGSVMEQGFAADDFEVIVVNDSGQNLPWANWQDFEQVRLMNTNRRERCIARNTGAAIAKGQYLWFLDDDDWILPGSMESLKNLSSKHRDAAWLYGGIYVVDGLGTKLAERNSGLSGNCFAQIMGGEWVPIQSSIINTDAFFKVGGFNPSIIVTEDQDLCRRISRIGELANTEAAVACLYRDIRWDTSSDYLRAPLDTQRSRDKVLDEPGVYSRMHSSANNAYWLGRIVRVYLSTIKMNLQQGRIIKAFGRALLAGISTVHAGRAIFSEQFRAGLRTDHVPGSLHFIMMDLEKAANRNQVLDR